MFNPPAHTTAPQEGVQKTSLRTTYIQYPGLSDRFQDQGEIVPRPNPHDSGSNTLNKRIELAFTPPVVGFKKMRGEGFIIDRGKGKGQAAGLALNQPKTPLCSLDC